MKAPKIIYLHQIIDAKSGIEVGVEWQRSKVAESDTAYFSEEAVKDLLTNVFHSDRAEEILNLMKKIEQ